MRRDAAVLALLCIGSTAPPGPPAPWPLDHYVRWDPGWGARTVEAAGIRVRIAPKRCGSDRPASEACGTGDPYLVATVEAPGTAPLRIEGEAGVGTWIGIGRLTARAARPSLILIAEDGGSGGCVQIHIATAEGAAWRAVRLSADPGDHGTLCEVDPARLAWPRDLTGRGRPEFLLADTRFSCRFTSCAGSWYPPRVVAFERGRGVDVSTDRALAPLYRADMAKARAACEHRTAEAQGACAGYAADAARLGLLTQAWRVIAAQVRRGCRVAATDVCPDIDRIPADFPGRLAPAVPITNGA